jgi:TolB protein
VVGVGYDPSWSPDGTHLAYTTLGPTGGVFVENADGSARKQVYLGDGARAPVWSPDGGSIAFYRKYRGPPLATVNGQVQYEDYFQVIVVRLADDSTWLPEEQPYHSFSPTWSPDGKNIVFQGDLGLYIVTPNQWARLIPNTDRNFTAPAYSPDGRTIAFTYRKSDHWDIGLIHPDGSGMHLLTDDSALTPTANSASAAWTPDGSGLAFASDRSGSWQLYLMAPDGSRVRPLNGLPVTYNGGLARVISWAK